MRNIATLERSLERLLISHATTSTRPICRSCRVAASQTQQSRKFSNSPQLKKRGLKIRREPDTAGEDLSKNPDYVPATTWDGLEQIGGRKWVEEQLDDGTPYQGYVR